MRPEGRRPSSILLLITAGVCAIAAFIAYQTGDTVITGPAIILSSLLGVVGIILRSIGL